MVLMVPGARGAGLRGSGGSRGVALPLAVFALLVIGMLVGASFFIGREAQSAGRNAIRLEQALAAAEAGLHLQLSRWDPIARNALAVGDSGMFRGPSGDGWYRGSVRRLNEALFLVRSEGFTADTLARQQVGMILLARPLGVRISAAFETQGPTVLGDSVAIDGYDRAPAGWVGCPGLEPPLPGIRIADSSQVVTGCPGGGCVMGDPAIVPDSTIDGVTLLRVGGIPLADLRSLATLVVAGGTRRLRPSMSGGTCDQTDPDNWGSPRNPGDACGGYFPMIWADGDLTILEGQGQGVLVVDGALTLTGASEFHGLVLVRGRLVVSGAGAQVSGALVVANAAGDRNELSGNTLVARSSCAVRRALWASARPEPLRSRSWSMLY